MRFYTSYSPIQIAIALLLRFECVTQVLLNATTHANLHISLDTSRAPHASADMGIPEQSWIGVQEKTFTKWYIERIQSRLSIETKVISSAG